MQLAGDHFVEGHDASLKNLDTFLILLFQPNRDKRGDGQATDILIDDRGAAVNDFFIFKLAYPAQSG
jgi:hypothetical protein